MLIGLGGGAASSNNSSGDGSSELDFASVQRGNMSNLSWWFPMLIEYR